MRNVRWGLVGAGDIAEKRVAPALAGTPGSELAAVSRRRAELAAPFARRYGAARWHGSWEALVADPEVDAVYVATPVHLHAPIAIAAAEAGKHVLCEKPMALSLAECDAMVGAAERHGVKLGIAYYRHLYPIVRRVRQLVEEGAIGTPVVARIEAFERFDGGPLATLTVTHAAEEPRDTLHVFGTEGSLHVPRLSGAELRVVRGESRTVEEHPAPENLHQPLVEQFVRAILEGGEPAVGGEAGREVNRVLAEIYGRAD